MRRHIHELLNANIEIETKQKKVEELRIEPKHVDKATAGQKGTKAIILLNGENNIIIQWKDALLADLSFIGIVVRLLFHRLNFLLSFNPSPLSLFFLLELNKIFLIAYTNVYIGCPYRLYHHLNPSRVRYSPLACPRSVVVGSALCSYFYLYCCTTDNDTHESTL